MKTELWTHGWQCVQMNVSESHRMICIDTVKVGTFMLAIFVNIILKMYCRAGATPPVL